MSSIHLTQEQASLAWLLERAVREAIATGDVTAWYPDGDELLEEIRYDVDVDSGGQLRPVIARYETDQPVEVVGVSATSLGADEVIAWARLMQPRSPGHLPLCLLERTHAPGECWCHLGGPSSLLC